MSFIDFWMYEGIAFHQSSPTLTVAEPHPHTVTRPTADRPPARPVGRAGTPSHLRPGKVRSMSITLRRIHRRGLLFAAAIALAATYAPVSLGPAAHHPSAAVGPLGLAEDFNGPAVSTP